MSNDPGTSDSRVYDSTWYNCTSLYGGAIDTGGTSTTEFHNITVFNNTAFSGAAVYHFGTEQVKFFNSRFMYNTAERHGGGAVIASRVNSSYTNCSFEGNVAAGGYGGGIYGITTGTPKLHNLYISNNRALDGNGGGVSIRANGDYVMDNITMVGNTASEGGGGFSLEDWAQVRGSKWNSVLSAGGMYTDQSTKIMISTAEIKANRATQGNGGAVAVAGASYLVMTQSHLVGNTAINGGALATWQKAMIFLSRTTISNNTATESGGAMYLASSSYLGLNDSSSVSWNQAKFGGAILTLPSVQPSLMLRLIDAFNQTSVASPEDVILTVSGQLQGLGGNSSSASDLIQVSSPTTLRKQVKDGYVSFDDVFSLLAGVNLGFEWVLALDFRSRCILYLSPLPRIMYELYAPSTPLIGLGVVWLCSNMYYRGWCKMDSVPDNLRWRTIAALICIVLWGYLIVTPVILNLLYCIPVGKQHVLTAAPSVICGSPEHIPYQVFGWIMLVVYVLGVPIGFAYLLRYTRRRLIVDPSYPLLRDQYCLFQPHLWFYELVQTIKKLALALLDVTFANRETERSMSLLFYFGISFCLQYCIHPFNSTMLNLSEDYLLLTLIIVSAMGLADVMRTHHLFSYDIFAALYSTAALGLLLVCVLLLLATKSGHQWLEGKVKEYPLLQAVAEYTGSIGRQMVTLGRAFNTSTSRRGSVAPNRTGNDLALEAGRRTTLGRSETIMRAVAAAEVMGGGPGQKMSNWSRQLFPRIRRMPERRTSRYPGPKSAGKCSAASDESADISVPGWPGDAADPVPMMYKHI
ncbi:hypothetical protein BCR44DRAFT_1509280 [Catenaria anguillulae PL171]|uniref:Right handed beta helix domain-containing protein n=1 Tax=Catenaria anguillulae PL171 TaxID=765915 RepID=A0A1Y2I4J4_9FUNG|nr:hypothetical protein BCR44DRAFT_1509280 [Catenaria anguillulae PL171]